MSINDYGTLAITIARSKVLTIFTISIT